MFPRQIFGNALFRDSDAVNFDTFMVLGMGMVRFGFWWLVPLSPLAPLAPLANCPCPPCPWRRLSANGALLNAFDTQ